MGNDQSFLITLSNGEYLIRVALKVPIDGLNWDAKQHPLEPENKEKYMALLPRHVRSFGQIVEVQTLFDSVAHLGL